MVTKRKMRRRRNKQAERFRQELLQALDRAAFKLILREMCKVDYRKPSPFVYLSTD